ncbi:sialidase family protein [soil metagenome]
MHGIFCLTLAGLITVFGGDKPPGIVIDHSPAKSRQYIGSPSLAILPNGDYIASHDFFGPGSTRDTTVVFGSSDKGVTWAKRATIKGQWWSTLFTHNDHLYLFGTTKEYGACVIRRSDDGGKTWTNPTNGKTGLLHGTGMYHCAPVPVVVHNGRIWRAMEEYTGPRWGAFKAFVMSAPEDADLLDAANWTSSNRIGPIYEEPAGKAGGVLEGNVVVTPGGEIVDVLRLEQPSFDELAVVMHLSPDGKTLTFDGKKDFIRFPGGSKKFTIRYDERTKKYWTLANHVPTQYRNAGKRPAQTRNTLVLACSTDLKNWEITKQLLTDPDVVTVGFQYVDWLFDGADIIAAVRMAYPEADGTKAHNAHDANWLTFHRFERFRDK